MAKGNGKTGSKSKPKTPAKKKVNIVNYQLTATLINLHNNHKDIYVQMEKEGINTKQEINYIYNWIHLKPTMTVRIATSKAEKPLTTWIKDNKKMERVQRENLKALEIFAAFSNSQVSGSQRVKTEDVGTSSTPIFSSPLSTAKDDVVTLEKRAGGAYQLGGKKVIKIEIE